jgi:hypothetical protein
VCIISLWMSSFRMPHQVMWCARLTGRELTLLWSPQVMTMKDEQIKAGKIEYETGCVEVRRKPMAPTCQRTRIEILTRLKSFFAPSVDAHESTS